jgi:Helix-turn-helix
MRREPRPRPARAAPALPATTGGARLCRALTRTCSRVRACRSGSPPTSPNSSTPSSTVGSRSEPWTSRNDDGHAEEPTHTAGHEPCRLATSRSWLMQAVLRGTRSRAVAAVYIYDPQYRGGVGIGRDGEAARLVRRARELSGLTQSQLAHRANVSQSVISAYESGRR